MRLVSKWSAALALTASACSQPQGQTHRQLTPAEKVAPIAAAVAEQPSSEITDLTAGATPDATAAKASLAKADKKAQEHGVTAATHAVHAQVRLKKAHLFDRTFLYGFDLQYSSGTDDKYALIPQAQSLGHIPATFRRLGDALQLVGDQTRLFESDVNHPEILINEYRIVAEDSDSISIEFARGGLIVNETLNGKGVKAPKQTWVRSFEFVEKGNYLLQETGLLLDDGSVQTVLESTFPRDSLVPDAYEPLLNDPALEPLAARYRFLTNEKVFLDFKDGNKTVRQQTQVADRFNLGKDGTIDWYVTANAPDDFLPALRSGVEGWNRYFEPQLGRKVMIFKGRLPAGAKIGDPRYNVINWDTVQDAGAAYESQAADPTTGIQSHSLIYMPYAWYNIGAELWHRRVDGLQLDAKKVALALAPKGTKEVFGDGHQALRCVRVTEDIGATAQQLVDEITNAAAKSGTAPTMTADEFGRRILISTLFHEVGHALGLAHNFKGSLAFDGTKPVSAANETTTSIMDYNYYMHELHLFGEIGTSAGSPLEYDRQIISQLYNKGADVKAEDKVVPACEDAEADNTDGGVDPLCQRYDSESEPILGVQHAYDNVVKAAGAAGFEQQTLTEAFASVQAPIAAKLASADAGASADAVLVTARDLGGKAGELARFYLASGAQSLRGNVRTNDKGFRVWAPGVLEGVSDLTEKDIRSKYFAIYSEAVGWRELPAVPKAAAAKLVEAVHAAVLLNPNAGADDATRALTADLCSKAFAQALDAKITLSLGLLRQAVVGLLGFSDANPFAVRFADDGDVANFESWSAKTLSAQVLQGLGTLASADIPALGADRDAAAAVLVTFKGIDDSYDDTIAKLTGLVKAGRTEGNQNLVDSSRKLLKALGN